MAEQICSNEVCKRGMKEHISGLCNRCRRNPDWDGDIDRSSV